MTIIQKPLCSIIVRTLNEERHLDDLLRAIRAQSYPSACCEVIVVDSGSTDRTLRIAEKQRARIVRIARDQFSFGRSLNLGCEHASGERLVFISGHCVPQNEGWLWNLVRPMHDDTVGVTYGRQMGGPESRFSEHAIFEKYFPPDRASGTQAPFFCNNANSALRARCWSKFRFDESLTGLEDMHLARRLVDSGMRVEYCPDAAVYHFHHETWNQVMRRYMREAIALRNVMPEVHVYWHDAARYFLAGVLGDLSRALMQRCLAKKTAEIFAFRFCQFYGAWRGSHLHRQLSHREKEKYFYPN